MVRSFRRAVLAAVTIPALLTSAATSASASQSPSGAFTDAVVAHPFAPSGTTGRTDALSPRVQSTAGTVPNARVQRSGASLVARPNLGPRSGDTTTSNWSYAGVDGNVKVGIIDFFDAATLTSEINGHEVSPVPNSRRKCIRNGVACTFGKSGSKHGNAMAEIIGDQASGVVLYLAEADTLRDYRAIIDWFAANGVKIVNHSLIGNFDGPGNGTGPQADIVNYAVSKGMAWFNSAGDMGVDSTFSLYAGSRWSGRWSDADNDGWLNFKGTDETLGTYCGALLGLRWSDWGAGRTDYQLWVNDVNIRTRVNGTAVLASDRNQAAGAAPLEANDFRWLCNTNAALGPVYDKNKDGFVALKVKRSTRSTAASSTGDVIEIQVNNGFLEYSTDAGSVRVGFADARSPGAATIGHLAQAASHGPTADARIKPDLITDGCSPTLAYGDCFAQTSYDSSDTATAKATGVAAMALDGLPAMSPTQLVQFMRNSANEDLRVQMSAQAAALPNNTEGWGTVELQGVPTPPTHRPAPFVAHDERLIDTRKPNSIRKGIAVVPRTGTIVMRVPPWGEGRPSGGTAVLNVTTLGTLGPGFVQVGPTGSTVPGAYSNLTVEKAGQTLSAMVFVPVGIDGKLTLYTTAGGHFIVDYLGAFDPDPAYNPFAVASGFLPVDPFRAYDSQCGGCAGPMTAGTIRDITIAGTGSVTNGWKAVPATGVTAVAVSVTAESPAGTGHLSVVSTSDAPPANTMTLQVSAGRAATGTTIVPVDANGRIRLWSTVTTPVQIDVLGYFATDAVGMFTPINGVRALDTRNTGPTAPGGGVVNTVDLAPFGVPADASAVIGSVGIAGPTGAGGLQVGRTADALLDTYRNVTVSAAGQGVITGMLSAVDQSRLSITTSTAAHRTAFVTGWFSSITRAVAGATTVVPMDPATPSDTITTFVASPNGQHLLIGHRAGAGLATISLYHRGIAAPANPYQALDLTVGAGVPNADVVPLGVSSDGRRVLFSSNATNITVGSNGTIYEIDLDGSALPVQVDRRTDGTREFGARFDPELHNMGYLIFDGAPGVNLYRFLVKPLAPGSPTTERFTSEWNPTISPDFTSAILAGPSGNALARLGVVGTIPYPGFGSNQQFSPDGRFMVDLVTVSAAGVDTRLFDLDTGTQSVLCRNTTFSFVDSLFDWSGGAPVAGSFCQGVHPFFDVVVSSGGSAEAVPTWTGLRPRNGSGLASASKIVAGGGVVMALTDASNLIPGVTPSSPQIYLWDNPQL